MRNLCLLIVSLVSFGAVANLEALLAAVRDNDVERAHRILLLDARERQAFINRQAELDPKDRNEPPPPLVNQADRLGIRPLFLVSSPEMAQLLFDFGAYLRNVEDWRMLPVRMHVDGFGRTPLHYLLSLTVQRLMRETPPAEREALIRRIEATALLLMRVNAQDDIQGQRTRLEFQEDLGGNIAYNYVGDWGWNPDFLNRLGRERVLHARALRREEEMQRRRREVQQEEQRRIDEERHRALAEGPRPEEMDLPEVQLLQPAPVRVAPNLIAPVARLASVCFESPLLNGNH